MKGNLVLNVPGEEMKNPIPMDVPFTFFSPTCLFSFYSIAFLTPSLAIYLSAIPCNFFLHSDYSFYNAALR